MDNPIDYRSDFAFLLEIKDGKGNVLPLSEVDFDGQSYTAIKPGYAFACKEGVCRNCALQGDKVLVICDNHGLQPGIVKVELRVHYPDELYPDGIRTEFHKVNTGIVLGDGCDCKPSDAIPTVTVVTPTFIGGGGCKIKAFRTSEYVCRGLIPSNAQPGNVYYCNRMKFDKLGLNLETGDKKREGRVDLSILFRDYEFDPKRLKINTPTVKWWYSVDTETVDGEEHQILTYDIGGYRYDDLGVQPFVYDLPYTGYWYIDRDGVLQEAADVLPRHQLPIFVPDGNMYLTTWEREWISALKGEYELQRRERVKAKRPSFDDLFGGSEIKRTKKFNKWVRQRGVKGDRTALFYLTGPEVIERIKGIRCGVFRLRRVCFNYHGTRSPWEYFTMRRSKKGTIQIKKL